MVFYEACRLVREVKVLLNALRAQCSVFCKVKRVRWLLSIIFRTAKEIRRVLVSPHIVAFVGAEIWVTLVYILGICEARDS